MKAKTVFLICSALILTGSLISKMVSAEEGLPIQITGRDCSFVSLDASLNKMSEGLRIYAESEKVPDTFILYSNPGPDAEKLLKLIGLKVLSHSTSKSKIQTFSVSGTLLQLKRALSMHEVLWADLVESSETRSNLEGQAPRPSESPADLAARFRILFAGQPTFILGVTTAERASGGLVVFVDDMDEVVTERLPSHFGGAPIHPFKREYNASENENFAVTPCYEPIPPFYGTLSDYEHLSSEEFAVKMKEYSEELLTDILGGIRDARPNGFNIQVQFDPKVDEESGEPSFLVTVDSANTEDAVEKYLNLTREHHWFHRGIQILVGSR